MNGDKIVISKELRQEAIKWIENFNCKWGKNCNKDHITPEEINIMNQQHAIKIWIQHFFNITEADLK